ncbi:MAG TPA: hypothetical protein VF498_03410 [Anaerolineales bacterium]
MDKVDPFIIALMFVARCLVPLLIMLGISYLLKRLGFIQEAPPPPKDQNRGNHENSITGGSGA